MIVLIRRHPRVVGDVAVGMRPEHLLPDQTGTIEIAIALAEPLGANTLLHGSLRGSSEAFTVNLNGIHQLPGSKETMKLFVGLENIHIFDRATGERINP